MMRIHKNFLLIVMATISGTGTICNYYYWLIYYFFNSYSSLPNASNNEELFSWCSVNAFKLWNKPNPEILGLRTLGYEHMIEFSVLMPTNMKSRVVNKDGYCQITYKSYVYRYIYLIFWPFVVLFYLIFVLKQFKYIWYKYMVRDIIGVLDFWLNYHVNCDKIKLLNLWTSTDTYCLGRHHFIIHCYLFNYFGSVNNFAEEYKIVNKKILGQKCKEFNISHPLCLGITIDETDAKDDYENIKYVIKPSIGSWGEDFLSNNKIYFVNCQKDAVNTLNCHKKLGQDWMAQECVTNIDLLSNLWCGKGCKAKPLGSFRMYTYKTYSADNKYSYQVLPLALLRFPDINTGITWEENECLLYVNMNENSKNKYKTEKIYIHGEDMIGSNKYYHRFDYSFFMNDMCSMIRMGHQKMVPNLVLCAWDVAMTTQGPMIIEVNINNDVYLIDMLQSHDNQFAKMYYKLSFQWLEPVKKLLHN